MNDIWKWLGEQFGNIFSVLGLATGFWFYWLSRKPKRFGYQVISKTRILAHQSVDLPLQVVYAGHEVSSPNILVLRLGNTGKAEIRAEDYEGPIKIAFQSSQILSGMVSGKSDDAIDADVISSGAPNAAVFKPVLLNPGEWVDLQFVTDGPLEIPSIHSRIAGQTVAVSDAEKSRKKVWRPVYWGALAVLALTPSISSMLFGEDEAVPAVLLLGVAIGLMIWAGRQMRTSSGWAKQPKEKSQKYGWGVLATRK